MDLSSRKDFFSRAVVRAVAAAAGVNASVPEFDSDSVDINFAASDTFTAPGARLDAQLKCSAGIDASGAEFSFDLKVKNYNDLRWPLHLLAVPRILIVVDVPPDPVAWLSTEPERIILKRCAYWLSVAGAPETTNTSTVTVRIPTEQVFDADTLIQNLRVPGSTL